MSRDPCISLLRELVSIDSVNPSLVAGASGEAAIADAIARYLRRLAIDVEIHEVAPGRPNVVAVLEGQQPGPALMFCGHTDTVGVEGMTAPFDPIERDGRLYGRGAQDMKSGVAAMLDALRVLSEQGLSHGRVIAAAVVDEEYASIGADALAAHWKADLAVVTEPTDLHIGVSHKGFVWLEVETSGVAAHGSRPRDGRDAILRMGRVLNRLEGLDRALQARSPHALLGTGSLHASIVSGGQELSSYPARCLLQMERRTLPGESADYVRQEVAEILDALAHEDPEFTARSHVTFSRPPYELEAGHHLPRSLNDVLVALGHESSQVGMSFWTDAAVLAEAGIPTVLFGPGGAGLHGTDEYVNIVDVLTCRDALVRLGLKIAGSGVRDSGLGRVGG